MADVAALGFSIDSSPVVSATEALENLNNEAQKAPGSIGRLTTASDALVAALNRNTSATDSLSSRISALEQAGAKTSTVINNITNVTQKATDNVVQFTGATSKARDELAATTAAADKMAQAWSRLGAAGAAVSKMQTPEGLAQFRMSSLSSNGSVPGQSGGGGGETRGISDEYRRQILQNIAFQGKDFFEQALVTGQYGRAALTQAPQVASLMQMGGLGVGDLASSVGSGLKSLAQGSVNVVSKLGLVGGAAAAGAAAITALVVAQQNYASGQLALAKQLAGTGRLSGLTATDVNAIAAAGGGGLSRGERRDYAGQLAATGLSGNILPGVLNSLKDFSATTSQDEASSLQTLAAAFNDPAKGAEALNKQLGLLDAAALENIQRLSAQGDKLGAQRALLDALNASLVKHTDLMTGWARVSEMVLTPIASLWDKLGEKVSDALSGGNIDKQITDLQRVLSTPTTPIEAIFGTGGREALQKQMDDLVKRRAQIEQVQQRSQQNVSSVGLDNALKSLNPTAQALQDLEDKAKAIRRPFTENWIDPSGAAKAAIDGMAIQTKQMKEDMAAGGAQFADALRAAQFGQRTVGYAPDALNVAQINKTQDDKIVEANRRASLDTSAKDYIDGPARERQLASIEEERKLLLSTAQQRATLSPGSYSTNIRDVPEQYRTQVYNAAVGAGIDPNLLASVFYQESRFRPDVINGTTRSSKGATGPFQFMPGTSSGLGINPLDFDQAANGAAGMLARSLKARNGDVALALADYNYGSGNVNARLKDGKAFPDETRKYIDDITRSRPSQQSDIAEQQQRNRQLQQEKDTLEALKAAGGENTAQYRAQAEVVQRLTEAQNKNQLISKSLTQQFEAEAKARQDIQMATQYQGFVANDNFARDQLGRSREDQAAASAARPYQGTSYYDQVFNRTKDTNSLTEAKSMITDGATSFVTALRRGAAASDALASAFGSAADKLLSKVLDSVISSAFGSVGGGGGGLASLFGGGGSSSGLPDFKFFSSGGYTGSGGRYEPAGVVHRGEVVWSQADVARYGGAAVVERMRMGYPGYADGGTVGGGPVTGGNSYVHAPVNVQMNGSSGDSQKDQAHLDNAVKAFRSEAISIFAQEQAKSLSTNGTLWKAGVRRASAS